MTEQTFSDGEVPGGAYARAVMRAIVGLAVVLAGCGGSPFDAGPGDPAVDAGRDAPIAVVDSGALDAPVDAPADHELVEASAHEAGPPPMQCSSCSSLGSSNANCIPASDCCQQACAGKPFRSIVCPSAPDATFCVDDAFDAGTCYQPSASVTPVTDSMFGRGFYCNQTLDSTAGTLTCLCGQ